VVHDASGSLRCGLLDVKKQVGEGIRAKYDLEEIGERTVEQAVQKGKVRLYGQDQDVSALVREAKQQVLGSSTWVSNRTRRERPKPRDR